MIADSRAASGDRRGDASVLDSGWNEPAVVSAFAEHWDRELHGLTVPSWRTSVLQILEYAAQYCSAPTLRVADMGCAAGVYARHLLQTGIAFEYHGYDHNRHILAETRRRWEFLPNEHVTFHEMDARVSPWPIPDSSFDVVLWDSTLRFCESIDEPIAQSARICRGMIVLARTPFVEKTHAERRRYYGMEASSVYWHFARDTVEECAARHGLRLTACVGADDTHVLSREPLRDLERIRPALDLAKRFHEAFVVERMLRVMREYEGEVLIFGAGQHSRWLWALLPDPLRERIAMFIDDRAEAGTRIGRCEVRRPQDLQGRSPAVIVVSSDSQEETLAARARETFGGHVPIVRLYETLPAGPYDKSIAGL